MSKSTEILDDYHEGKMSVEVQMITPHWAQRMMALATVMSTWSKDPRTKVGAVVVDSTHRILASGYNGFPRGVADIADRYGNPDAKYKLIVHAEANCILNAVAPLSGGVMVTMKMPCSDCTKLIVQSGICAVVYGDEPHGVWVDDARYSRLMMTEAGIALVSLSELCASPE